MAVQFSGAMIYVIWEDEKKKVVECVFESSLVGSTHQIVAFVMIFCSLLTQLSHLPFPPLYKLPSNPLFRGIAQPPRLSLTICFNLIKASFFRHIFSLPEMEKTQLRRQLANVRQSLFDQGFLDEQFVQLEELQDDANPNFVEEIVTLYYRDSSRLILSIEQALQKSPLDLSKLDALMHQFKGSSSSIGAKKVKAECTQLREYCKAGSGEGCLRTFQQLKKEYTTLRKKLEAYFQLARQAGPTESACRPK